MKRAPLHKPTPLTAAQRATVMSTVKPVLVRFRWAVARKDPHLIQQITEPMSRDELAALAILCADCITDGQRLVALAHSADDGQPEPQVRTTTHAA